MEKCKILAGTALTLVLATAAHAQTAEGQATAATDTTGVQEVIVTAERRSTKIERTPIAITAISGNDARKKGLNSVGDILAQTPAVVVQNSTKGQAVFIRGIGSTGDAQEGGDPAVNLNIDGVYEQQAIIPLASSLDVNRVEVLRGPQGTLYGRNSNAGSVNIITNDPTLGAVSGYVNVDVGNYDSKRIETAVNVPLSDKVAARLAVVGNQHDGYYSNGGGSADGYAARAKVKAWATDRLTVTVSGLYSRETGNPASTVPAPLNTSDPYNTTYPAYDGTNGNPYFPPLSASATVMPHGVQDVKFSQVNAQIDYNFDFATLTVLPAFSHTYQYADTALLPFGASAQETSEDARSLEARLASSPTSRITWVTGLYAYSADDHRNPFPEESLDFVHAAVSLPANQAIRYSSRSYAAFGQVTVPVTDRFRLTGGARYTHDLKATAFGYYTSETERTAVSVNTNAYSRSTYKGGAQYDLSAATMIYGQVSTGFKAGGVNPNGSSYDPEEITAYEAGLKTRFFDNKVHLNLSAYNYIYDGYQARVNAPDCSDSNGYSQQTINAANLKNYGGEAEVNAAPTRHDRFYATAAYLHANGRFQYDNGTCSAGVITHDYLDITGAPPNSPKWSGLIGYEHRFDLPRGALSARVDMRWSGAYDTSIDDSEYDHQDSFTRTDATFVYTLPGDKVSIRAYVRNIEDKAQKLFTLAPPIPFAALELSDPRTYGVSLMVQY
ncbi:MAG: TonB-dependent receptor [Asticcacaulis sp.]|uniref:TonB-dependent receptor n=1 Tax=Asticcacaulis sp. TaxID=1872648 RepID=UPI0039E4CC1F